MSVCSCDFQTHCLSNAFQLRKCNVRTILIKLARTSLIISFKQQTPDWIFDWWMGRRVIFASLQRINRYIANFWSTFLMYYFSLLCGRIVHLICYSGILFGLALLSVHWESCLLNESLCRSFSRYIPGLNTTRKSLMLVRIGNELAGLEF